MFWCFGLDFKEKSEDYDIMWVNLGIFLGTFFMVHAMLVSLVRTVTLKNIPFEG